jgi:thioredoxin-like negative regulator of GroEL
MVDADPAGEVLASFGASSLPTYIVFRDGVEIDRLTLNVLPLFIEQRLRGMVATPRR